MLASDAAASSEQSSGRPRRLLRIAAWIGGVALAVFILDLLGIPVSDWIADLLEKIGEVPPWAIVSGSALQTVQTALVALAWLGILRAAFPRDPIPYRVVLACYATAVALNGFLPANIGTFVMLAMFSTLFASATFAAAFSGLVVQKIPFSIFNIGLYLYLFLTVTGSFSIKLGFLSDHTALIALIAIGAVVLVALLTRIFWRRTEKLRARLITGGAILRSPRELLVRVALPELGSYVAKLGVIAIFLGAYGIPVSFHNVATVAASNSISNSVSATPGGVGVNQAMNTAALRNETSKSNATAYSAAQQLITTAWNVIFAMVLVTWAFGWTGGRELVSSSYGDAKVRSREMSEQRKKRKRERMRRAGDDAHG